MTANASIRMVIKYSRGFKCVHEAVNELNANGHGDIIVYHNPSKL